MASQQHHLPAPAEKPATTGPTTPVVPPTGIEPQNIEISTLGKIANKIEAANRESSKDGQPGFTQIDVKTQQQRLLATIQTDLKDAGFSNAPAVTGNVEKDAIAFRDFFYKHNCYFDASVSRYYQDGHPIDRYYVSTALMRLKPEIGHIKPTEVIPLQKVIGSPKELPPAIVREIDLIVSKPVGNQGSTIGGFTASTSDSPSTIFLNLPGIREFASFGRTDEATVRKHFLANELGHYYAESILGVDSLRSDTPMHTSFGVRPAIQINEAFSDLCSFLATSNVAFTLRERMVASSTMVRYALSKDILKAAATNSQKENSIIKDGKHHSGQEILEAIAKDSAAAERARSLTIEQYKNALAPALGPIFS